MTGYRGLFGREIGADEWVIRIANVYFPVFEGAGNKFSLYGHSAGSQFTGRFLVTHPDLIGQAVITAAATYPQPTTDIPWPFGMGDLLTEIEWDKNTINQVEVNPDPQTWLAATQVPLTVLVGLQDTSEQPPRPGQNGNTRIMIARNWLKAMQEFSTDNGYECIWNLDLVPGIGHSDGGLVLIAQQIMLQE